MTTPLIEAIARAVAERLEAFDIHGIPQAALTAITEAGYSIVETHELEMTNRALMEYMFQPLTAISAAQGDG